MALSLIRRQAEIVRPPRALHVQFPLGRPLGRPGDRELQHRVLSHAFSLLDRTQGPVLEDFPETIADHTEALSCPLPPAADTDLHPAVAECIGVRDAYERHRATTGRTAVGRIVDADGMADAVAAFVALAAGSSGEDLGFEVAEDRLAEVAMDIRAYFEEAAAELAGHVPEARATESWFFRDTHAGRAVLTARRRLADDGRPRTVWWGMAPVSQEGVGEAERLWHASRDD